MDPAMYSYDCTTEFNVTDHERAIELLRDPFEDVLHAVIIPLLMLIGLLFNSAFIHVVRRVPSMHTVTNAYLVNVSIADLIFVMVGGSIMSWWRFSSLVRNDAQWLGSSFPGCFSAYFVPYLPYFTSILLMTFVTTEKYDAICRPLQYRTRTSRTKMVVKRVTASWTIGVVLAAASVLQFSNFEELCISWPEDEIFTSLPTRVAYCIALPGVQVFSDLFTVIPFFVALIRNTVMYARIIIALNKSQTDLNTLTRNSFVTKSRIASRNQVAKLLIVNGTLFFLLQMPFRLTSVQNIMVYLTGEGILTNNQYHTLVFYGRSLLFINSLINPVVYVCVNAQYRRGFIETFSRRK